MEKEKKDGEDKAAKEAMTFQERTFNLVNIGMAIVGASFIVKNEFGDIASISIDEVKAIDEDVWPRRLIEVTTSVEDVKKQTDKKRQEAIDKANALKPQITKAREYLAAILDIEFPEVTEDKLDGIMSTFKEDLFNAMNKANKALEQVK